MSTLQPGNQVSVTVSDKTYIGVVAQGENNMQFVDLVNEGLHGKMVDTFKDGPMSFTVAKKAEERILTSDIVSEGAGRRIFGYGVGHGDLSDKTAPGVNVFPPRGTITSVLARSLKAGGTVGYIEVGKPAFEMVGRTATISLLEHTETITFKDNEGYLTHSGVAAKVSDALKALMLAQFGEDTTHAFTIDNVSNSIFTGKETYYYLDDATNKPVTNMAEVGFTELTHDTIESNVRITLDPSKYELGEKIAFKNLKAVGIANALGDFEFVVTDYYGAKVIIIDPSSGGPFNWFTNRAVTKVFTVEKVKTGFVPDFTIPLILNADDTIHWVNDGPLMKVDARDSWLPTEPDGSAGKTHITGLDLIASRKVVLINFAATSAQIKDYDLTLTFEVTADDNSVSVHTQTVYTGRGFPSPCLEITPSHGNGEIDLYQHIYDLALNSENFEFKLGVSGSLRDTDANLQLRARTDGDNFIVDNTEPAFIAWRKTPDEKQTELTEFTVVDGVAKFTATGNCKAGNIIQFRAGEMLNVMVPLVGTDKLTGSESSDLAYALEDTVNYGPLILECAIHDTKGPFTMFPANSGSVIGFEVGYIGAIVPGAVDGVFNFERFYMTPGPDNEVFILIRDSRKDITKEFKVTLSDAKGNSIDVEFTEDAKYGRRRKSCTVSADWLADLFYEEPTPFDFNFVVKGEGEPDGPDLEPIKDLLEQHIAAIKAGKTETLADWVKTQDLLWQYHAKLLKTEGQGFFTLMNHTTQRFEEEAAILTPQQVFRANKELPISPRQVRQFESWISLARLPKSLELRRAALRRIDKSSIVVNFIDNYDQHQIMGWVNS